MPELDVVLRFTTRLAAAGVEHMVTGSIACILYGEPRLTHDVDVVVALPHDVDVDALERAFPLDAFYLPPAEVIRVEAARSLRGHFNIIEHDSGFKADVYVAGRDPLHAWAFARRRRLAMAGGELVVAPPEYVVVRKLEFWREGRSEKHLDDIAGMLRVSGEEVDTPELRRLIDERGLGEGWAAARARV